MKSLYAIPTWSRTAALISEHAALRDALGDAPSVYALYRFATKLRQHQPLVDACLDRVTASLRAELPDYGRDVAIDASDLPAYVAGVRGGICVSGLAQASLKDGPSILERVR